MHCNKEEKEREKNNFNAKEREKGRFDRGERKRASTKGRELRHRGERKCTFKCVVIERRDRESFNAKEREREI
jgi:hypothetical protein